MSKIKKLFSKMKKINKLSFLVALLFLGSFWSCSENDDVSSHIHNSVSASDLESIHRNVESSFKEEIAAYENNEEVHKTRNAKIINDFNLEFEKNLNVVNENGLNDLFEKKDINRDILSALTFYQNNYLNPSIYNLLAANFNFSVEDAKKLFQFIEVVKFIEKNAQSFYNRSFIKRDGGRKTARISRDCAEAIGGTLLATAGAAAVGGPLGLGLFLAAKAYSVYQLVRACG